MQESAGALLHRRGGRCHRASRRLQLSMGLGFRLLRRPSALVILNAALARTGPPTAPLAGWDGSLLLCNRVVSTFFLKISVSSASSVSPVAKLLLLIQS